MEDGDERLGAGVNLSEDGFFLASWFLVGAAVAFAPLRACLTAFLGLGGAAGGSVTAAEAFLSAVEPALEPAFEAAEAVDSACEVPDDCMPAVVVAGRALPVCPALVVGEILRSIDKEVAPVASEARSAVASVAGSEVSGSLSAIPAGLSWKELLLAIPIPTAMATAIPNKLAAIGVEIFGLSAATAGASVINGNAAGPPGAPAERS